MGNRIFWGSERQRSENGGFRQQLKAVLENSVSLEVTTNRGWLSQFWSSGEKVRVTWSEQFSIIEESAGLLLDVLGVYEIDNTIEIFKDGFRSYVGPDFDHRLAAADTSTSDQEVYRQFCLDSSLSSLYRVKAYEAPAVYLGLAPNENQEVIRRKVEMITAVCRAERRRDYPPIYLVGEGVTQENRERFIQLAQDLLRNDSHHLIESRVFMEMQNHGQTQILEFDDVNAADTPPRVIEDVSDFFDDCDKDQRRNKLIERIKGIDGQIETLNEKWDGLSERVREQHSRLGGESKQACASPFTVQKVRMIGFIQEQINNLLPGVNNAAHRSANYTGVPQRRARDPKDLSLTELETACKQKQAVLEDLSRLINVELVDALQRKRTVDFWTSREEVTAYKEVFGNQRFPCW